MSQQPFSLVIVFCLFLKGDIQSQAVVRAIARQVCEQLIQSEFLVRVYILYVHKTKSNILFITMLSCWLISWQSCWICFFIPNFFILSKITCPVTTQSWIRFPVSLYQCGRYKVLQVIPVDRDLRANKESRVLVADQVFLEPVDKTAGQEREVNLLRIRNHLEQLCAGYCHKQTFGDHFKDHI